MRKIYKHCILDCISYLYIICSVWAILPKQLEAITQNITSFIAVNFSWYYLLLVLIIFLFAYTYYFQDMHPLR